MPISPTKQILNIVRQTWRQLNTKRVPFDRLLCGGEDWLSAAQYADHTGNCRRPSTPFSQSPHVQLLQQYQQIGDEIFRPEVFQKTAYFANAVECMDVTGHYFSCTRPEQVEQVARRFVARLRNEAPKQGNQQPEASSAYFSAADSQGVTLLITLSVEKRQRRLNLAHKLLWERGDRDGRAHSVHGQQLTQTIPRSWMVFAWWRSRNPC